MQVNSKILDKINIQLLSTNHLNLQGGFDRTHRTPPVYGPGEVTHIDGEGEGGSPTLGGGGVLPILMGRGGGGVSSTLIGRGEGVSSTLSECFCETR